MVGAIDCFRPYLQAILTGSKDSTHQDWQEFYLPTQAELPLRVQTCLPSEASSRSREEKREQMEVLTGLRKYASGHVLIVGKPGSGKSTSLKRLCWEEARRCREAQEQGNSEALQVPVFLELRGFQDNSVLQLIQRSLRQGKLRLSEAEIEDLLFDGQLLLLFDGLNELPSDDAWQQVDDFRRDYVDIPMIFSTRELGAGADLGIEKKLEMMPLTEPQMRQFIEKRLPGQAENLLRQIHDRLRELAETPLLLKMLCDVFDQKGQIPNNRGELFRKEFARRYEEFKPLRGRISEDSRRFAPELLQYLAFTMIQGDPHSDPCKPTPPWLTVPKTKAEQILAVFLAGGREPDWETKAKAKEWLEDLLEHHLLQLANDPDKIEFHHQLFQEYYASEWLLLKLPALSDEQLKYYFLNYLKWTEAIGLMMGSSDESQAMRVVKLALDIDLRLGARLAGEVKLRDQEKTFELVDSLVTPSWLKVKLLSETRSDFAIPPLQRFLKNSDASIRFDAVEGFKNIGSKDAANSLVAALEDEEINWTVAEALSQIGSREIIPALLKFLKHEQPNVRMAVVEVLGKTNGEGIILGLLEALEDEHEDVRYGAIKALRDRAEADTTPNLINALEDTEYSVRKLAAQALGNIRHEMAISSLLKVALQDEDKEVREAASEALKKIGAEAFISDAIKALKEDNKLQVRFNAIDLAKRLKYKGFVSELLLITLEDKEDEIRRQAAFALGAIEDEAAIKGLLQVALEKHWRVKPKFFVCQPRAIEALGRIKDKRAVSGLIELLGNCRSSTRWRAAKALGEIKDESAVLALINALEDEHIDIRIMAAEALGKIGDKRAIPGLLEMLNDENPDVCREAVDAFYRKLTCKESLPGLISALEKVDPNDRYLVVMALDKIGDKASVPVLIRILKEDKGNDKMLCRYAAEALGKIKDRTAIPALLKILELEHNKARFSSLNSGKPENYEDPNFFSFILYVLQQFQDLKVLSCFHEALAHPNAEIREDAAGMLRSFASHESIPFLVKAIQDAEPGVRAKAALTLAAIGGKVAGRAVLKLLEEEEEDYVRGEIAEWIPMQHRELALSILNKAIDDIDYSVRYHAVRGAKRLSGEDTIPLLLKAIQDLDEMPRREAVSALSNLEADCSSKVLPRLTTLISNHSGQEAFQAIVNIQKKCQFYNYDIAKSPPPPAVNQTSGAGNQGQTIFNIGTFNANNSNLNLGGTIQGDQLINQPHKSES